MLAGRPPGASAKWCVAAFGSDELLLLLRLLRLLSVAVVAIEAAHAAPASPRKYFGSAKTTQGQPNTKEFNKRK